jgi:hypothetical protein
MGIILYYFLNFSSKKISWRKVFKNACRILTRQKMNNNIPYAGCAPFDDNVSEETVEKVVSALENKKYDWRTIDGIMRDTNLSRIEVENVLNKLDNENRLVQSRSSSDKRCSNSENRNEPIFTTRNYYNKSRGILEQIKSSWADAV